MEGTLPCTTEFTERAARQCDALPEDQRELHKLAEDPFTPVSRAVGGEARGVALAPRLSVHYTVHEAVLVLMSVAHFRRCLIDDE
ncbi:hypothetical protein [Streptomyces sp. JNUCC 63]